MASVHPQSATHFLNGEIQFVKVLPTSAVSIDRKSGIRSSQLPSQLLFPLSLLKVSNLQKALIFNFFLNHIKINEITKLFVFTNIEK